MLKLVKENFPIAKDSTDDSIVENFIAESFPEKWAMEQLELYGIITTPVSSRKIFLGNLKLWNDLHLKSDKIKFKFNLNYEPKCQMSEKSCSCVINDQKVLNFCFDRKLNNASLRYWIAFQTYCIYLQNYRPEFEYFDKDDLRKDCNSFAAEIVAPSEWLVNDLKTVKKNLSKSEKNFLAISLSKKYQVSFTVMSIRLQRLSSSDKIIQKFNYEDFL